jgi:hypothetical protein
LAEAVDCCAELAAVPAAYLACISDFCASGLCIAVDPEPCAVVNCSSLEVCVAGSCIQNPDGEVLRVSLCVCLFVEVFTHFVFISVVER